MCLQTGQADTYIHIHILHSSRRVCEIMPEQHPAIITKYVHMYVGKYVHSNIVVTFVRTYVAHIHTHTIVKSVCLCVRAERRES